MVKRIIFAGLLAACAFLQPVWAADIAVGPARAHKTLAAGVAAAKAGDRILLDSGVYQDDTAITSVPLTIQGEGNGAILRITRPIPNRKGIIVTNANLTVRNVTFDGAYVTKDDGNNGAGIRGQAGDLLVENCSFINNQDGLLVNAIPGATVTVTHSTFRGNGAGDGYSHGMYINEVAQVNVRDSTFAGTKSGHDVKSRALRTNVTNVILDDGVSGTTSYAVDLPNGGVAVLEGLRVTQGENTENPAMIAYGAEGKLKAESSLTIRNSSFTDRSHRPSAAAVKNFTTLPMALSKNTYDGVRAP